MSTISASTTSTTAYKVAADTTGTLVLQTGATPTTALTLGTDQSATFAGAVNAPNTFGFKNRIINGAMMVNQRGASGLTSGTGVLTYSLDRFFTYATGAAVTMSQYTGVNFGSNVTSVLQVTGATSNSSFNVGQRIEAANIRDLAGQSVTFSAWVYQTTGSTQTFTVNAYTPTATDNWTSQNTYSSVVTASVPSGTWTFVSGTFTLNSTAQYGAGFSFGNFALGNGQQFAVGNVQLEKGSTATSFDYRPYGTELALCQRYCINYNSANANGAFYRYCYGECHIAGGFQGQIQLPVTMRIIPSVTTTGTAANYGIYSRATVTALNAAPTIGSSDCSPQTIMMNTTVAGGLTQGSAGSLLSNNNQTSYLIFSAEL